jgi:hypothetical protein
VTLKAGVWKGAKCGKGFAATGKIPSPEKFCNQQNLAAHGVKAEPEKFAHQCKHWARRKKKERCQGAARICHRQNLVPRHNILDVTR